MTPTQRADIGNRFLTWLEARMIVLQEQAAKIPCTADLDKYENVQIGALAREAFDNLGLTGVTFQRGKLDSDYNIQDEDRAIEIVGSVRGGIATIKIPLHGNPKLYARVMKLYKLQQENREKNKMCEEKATLKGMTRESTIGAFQTFVSRLWSPRKDEVLSATAFDNLRRQFIASRTTATCSI